MNKYPTHLLKLIDMLKKLPGVGTKSAERFAFDMIGWPQERLDHLAHVVKETSSQLRHCHECGCLCNIEMCPFCKNNSLHSTTLCVVASSKDVFNIESTHEYIGLYHVLGALLSPIDGIGPDSLQIGKIKERIIRHNIQEVIIALDSTLEGDATALYLKQELADLNVNVSRLAFGLPMGSSLDYVDGGTLARAFTARSRF